MCPSPAEQKWKFLLKWSATKGVCPSPVRASLIGAVWNIDHPLNLCSPARDDTHPRCGDLPPTVHPAPDSSVPVCLGAPARRRLISHSFPDENISRIEEIITNNDETRLTDNLPRDAAQTFIDVVHEVRLHVPSHPRRGLITSILFQ